jgi:hypothetical protein
VTPAATLAADRVAERIVTPGDPTGCRPSPLDEIRELLAELGFDGLAAAPGAGPYQRSDDRKGHATGFKPRTVRTRVGASTLAVEDGGPVDGPEGSGP